MSSTNTTLQTTEVLEPSPPNTPTTSTEEQLRKTTVGEIYVARHDNGRGRYVSFVRVVGHTKVGAPRVETVPSIKTNEWSDPCDGWGNKVTPDLANLKPLPKSKSAGNAARWTSRGYHIGDQYYFNSYQRDLYNPNETYENHVIYA